MKTQETKTRQIKIDSDKYPELAEWRDHVERALSKGALPIIKNFNGNVHMGAVREIALCHSLTVILNPELTECHFRRHP